MKHSSKDCEFVRHDVPLDDLEAAPARQIHHGLAGDAVEEAVGDRRVERAVRHEEDIGAGAFGDVARQSSIIASA